MKDDPTTVTEAFFRKYGKKWQEAMREEINSFEENEAWELVENREDKTVVEYKWVFKRKCDNENSVRYRARLVVSSKSWESILTKLFHP